MKIKLIQTCIFSDQWTIKIKKYLRTTKTEKSLNYFRYSTLFGIFFIIDSPERNEWLWSGQFVIKYQILGRQLRFK